MSLEIREADFNSRNDIEAFVGALENCVSEIWSRHGEFGFLAREWAVGFFIGRFMRQDHVKEGEYVNTRFYVISEGGVVQAIGLRFPAYLIPLNPIIEVIPLLAGKDVSGMYTALATKLKAEGYPKIYCHIIRGSTLEGTVPLRGKIADYPQPPRRRVYTLWEMNV